MAPDDQYRSAPGSVAGEFPEKHGLFAHALRVLRTRDREHGEHMWASLLMARIRLRGCTSIGSGIMLVGRPRIINHGTIKLGARVLIHSTVVPVELAAVDGGAIEIGHHSYLNYGVSISSHQLVRIGTHCMFGTYVNILDNDWHTVEDHDKTPPSKPVIIADNVWLGHHVIVLPGVTIGEGAVVGAGSVVTKDIPARSVAVGNPARVVRTF
jgi:carbonic anhydrase/acetyltransferase-like protein (isoleucine patch superfamily)